MVRGRDDGQRGRQSMEPHHLIKDISMCIVAAWLLSLVARFIRLPLMIAYLAAGVLLGPVGFGWIAERSEIETIAELGLIFLLFMIGLEIDLKRIVSAGRAIVLTSVIQFVGGAALGVALFVLLGFALSSFPCALDVTATVTTLRDFFITLFFVALGMSIPAPTSALLGWASVLCVFLLLSRFLTVFLPLYWMKLGHRASLLPTINLCQVSEFSLVILALGAEAGHINESTKGI